MLILALHRLRHYLYLWVPQTEEKEQPPQVLQWANLETKGLGGVRVQSGNPWEGSVQYTVTTVGRISGNKHRREK